MTSAEAWDVLSRYGLLLPALACFICIGLVLVLRPVLVRYALSVPNARSSHRIPTPQGGGIAVLLAMTGAILVVVLIFRDFKLIADLGIVFAAVSVIAIAGAIDDVRPIPITPRLVIQALVVATLVAALPAELRVAPLIPFGIERALLLLAGVWFVNLTNFMDGIDWITVAEVVPITLGLVAIGALGGLPMHGLIVALAFAGAMIGFAPFNRPVASLFLGDVGSLPIGLLLAWLLALVAARGHAAAALLLPLYYLADATVTLIRRMVNGDPFWQAHRTHFYQRATDHGLPVLQVVGRIFVTNVVLVALAVLSVLRPSMLMTLGTLTAGTTLVALLLRSFSRGQSGYRSRIE